MLEKVKLALRISDNDLDSDITRAIEGARAELIRSGVPEKIVNDENNALVQSAIVTFVKAEWFSLEDMRTSEGLMEAFRLMQENLRKSGKYV